MHERGAGRKARERLWRGLSRAFHDSLGKETETYVQGLPAAEICGHPGFVKGFSLVIES